MTWYVSADPLYFEEAVDWFRALTPITDEDELELDEYARRRSWKVAGVAQLDIVEDLFESIGDAIETGQSFDAWKREQKELLKSQWGSPNSPRVETIFRNATQQAHNAGRWQQMTKPDLMLARPYGLFDGVRDSRQTEVCKAWDGTVMLLSEFAAHRACPQLHHRCRSQIRNITAADARRRGISSAPPQEQAADGFGTAPDVAEWHVDPTEYEPGIAAQFERKAHEMRAAMKPAKLAG